MHPQAGAVRVVDNPIRMSASRPAQVFNPAPMLGEHTEQVLDSLGYADRQIADMRERGLVA